MESTSSMLMAVGFSLGIHLFAGRLCIAISYHPRTWPIVAVWIRVSDLELFLLSSVKTLAIAMSSFLHPFKELQRKDQLIVLLM